jgi:hypothetical protein
MAISPTPRYWAEPIRAELPDRFATLLAPAGFDPRAFVPCYGMAERRAWHRTYDRRIHRLFFPVVRENNT